MHIHFKAVSALAASLMTAGSYAATFNFPGATQSISSADFARAVDRAGPGGTITFPPRAIEVTGALIVDEANLTVRARGTGRARLTNVQSGRVSQIFSINSPGVTLRRLRIEGQAWPTFGPADDPSAGFENNLADREGAAVLTGVDSAVRVRSGATDFSLINCRIRRASNGIRYSRNVFPAGLVAMNSQFTTNRAMFWMTDEGDSGATVEGPMAKRFVIDNCDFIDEAGRGVASTGVYWDFGNTGGRTINLRGSIIRNCSFVKMSKWNIAFARCSNLIIDNNVFLGGGEHGDIRFVHPLHFEDVGDRRRPITITNNSIRQDRRTNGVRLQLADHIWTGGDNGRPVLSIGQGNTYSGISNRLVRVDR